MERETEDGGEFWWTIGERYTEAPLFPSNEAETFVYERREEEEEEETNDKNFSGSSSKSIEKSATIWVHIAMLLYIHIWKTSIYW